MTAGDRVRTGSRRELTDLEFVLLCADHRIGGLPAPFVFTSRTRYADNYEAEKAAVRAGLARMAGSELDAFTATLSRPDLMVVAHAWDTRAPADPAGVSASMPCGAVRAAM